jgi:hypothetical protein
MTEASKASYIKGEQHRVSVKNHILNYFKQTGKPFTVRDIEYRLWYDYETVKKRISDLELEGKLKIIGTLGGYSLYIYSVHEPLLTKTQAWMRAVNRVCPEKLCEILEVYNKLKR